MSTCHFSTLGFLHTRFLMPPIWQNHGDLDRVLGGIRQHVLGALNLRDLLVFFPDSLVE